jgi:hypothetical protein
MVRRHAADTAAVTAAATLLTLLLAAAVLQAPADRIFGAAIVGRHHDPFTVMQQFARPLTLGVYSQPLTDLTGAAIARATGAVAAYNWLVLASFPLAAAAAYVLARYLALPRAGAVLAALLFAFSPVHVAHAAYHPHVAQTQWLPLYLLALWLCLDRGTWAAGALLAAAAGAVALSNFYGGLIAAVMTPFAVAGWLVVRTPRAAPHVRGLKVTAGTLAGVAVVAAALLWWHAPAVIADRAALAFPRADLFLYSAKWWSYLMPPVVHPLWGGAARRIWEARQVHEGLLEQQVSLGWSVLALAAIGIAGWWRARRTTAALAPMLAALAAVALVCSLSPERQVFGATMVRPAALLYAVAPMFRAYARFGIVVQLMAALLAGLGAAHLLAAGTKPARTLCAALVVLAIAEYAVSPATLSRDVLPTAAHRWVMQQTGTTRALDCDPLSDESASIPWLTAGRISVAGGAIDDCGAPQLAAQLRAHGFTHLLVRDSWQRDTLRERGDREGLHDVARFADADVFAVGPGGRIYTDALAGFWPREHGLGHDWRWMGTNASWTIVAPAAAPRVVLRLEISAFGTARPLRIRLDQGVPQTLQVATDRRMYRVGPLALTAGPHRLTFDSPAPPLPPDAVVGNGDRRALGFAFGDWQWCGE